LAKESSTADRGRVVGHEIGAEFVALVDGSPQRSAGRFEGETHGIAQAAGEDLRRSAGGIDLPHRSPALLCGNAVLHGVAVRSDADIEPPPVGAGDEALVPMVIDPAGGQGADDASGAADPRRAGDVGEDQQAVAVGDVERVANEGHPERSVQSGDERRPGFRDAVAVGIAQQGDAVRAGYRGPRSFWNTLNKNPLMPLPSSGFGGAFVSATRMSPFGCM
jgi:hypothetical protein